MATHPEEMNCPRRHSFCTAWVPESY